jgi:hypothetical protein
MGLLLTNKYGSKVSFPQSLPRLSGIAGILLEKDPGQAGVTNQGLILMNSLVTPGRTRKPLFRSNVTCSDREIQRGLS